MKNINLKILVGSVVVSLGLTGCVKNINDTQIVQDDFGNTTRVQVYNAAVGTTRNSIYVDGVPVNYATLAYTGQFPASPNTSFQVAPGLRAFEIRDTLRTSAQPRLVFAENLQTNTYYTIFQYDTMTSTKQKTVLTKIQFPNDGTARIRFANFAYSPNAIPAIDIFSVKRNANIFSNVAVTDVTEFVSVPAGIVDTFWVRVAGTGTNLLNYTPAQPTANPPVPSLPVSFGVIMTPAVNRSYTLVFRGGYRSVVTNNSTVRTLSVFTNY